MNQFDAIADVFGGSGWLSLYAKKLNPKLKVFLNDADRELFNLLNSIKSGKLLEEIKTFEEKNPTYFEYLKESEKKKKAEKEWKETFNSWLDGFSEEFKMFFALKLWVCASEYNKEKPSYSMIWSCRLNISETLVETFKTFELSCLDYKTFLSLTFPPKTLFIFDPPYFCTQKTYKHNYFNVDAYISLLQLVSTLPAYLFVSYDSEFLRYLIKHECETSTVQTYETQQSGSGSIQNSRKKNILKLQKF